MTIHQSTIIKVLRRTTAVTLLAVSAVSAFAVLGDGKGKTPKTRSLLSIQSNQTSTGSFSLKSGFNFRGSQVMNTKKPGEFINVNTVVTYQKGNTTYIVPLKKKIFIRTTANGITISH